MKLTDQTFLLGQQVDNGNFYLAAQDPELTAEGTKHTATFKWTREKGWETIGGVEYETVAMIPSSGGFWFTMVSPVGLITDLAPDNTPVSLIYTPDGEVSQWIYQSAARIGDNLYAATIQRQVFMRGAGEEAFKLISSEAMTEQTGPGAIMGLAGFGPSEVYGVATEGEIWQYDGRDWQQRDSGTSYNLTDIAAGPDYCVAVGQGDTILIGRADEWRALRQDVSNEDFWGVEYFDGAFYISSAFGVYRLKGDTLEDLFIGDAGVRTCYGLSVGPSGIWSVGASDVALYDGKKWELIGQSEA